MPERGVVRWMARAHNLKTGIVRNRAYSTLMLRVRLAAALHAGSPRGAVPDPVVRVKADAGEGGRGQAAPGVAGKAWVCGT